MVVTPEKSIAMQERDLPKIVGAQYLHMEKDSTTYDLLVLKIVGNFCFGSCGCISGSGYLVIEGLSRKAYLFTEFISDGHYVAEKLSQGICLSDKDIKNIMLLMKVALPGGSVE